MARLSKKRNQPIIFKSLMLHLLEEGFSLFV